MTSTLAPAAPPLTRQGAGIPFARLLRVELRKATDTRAARWLLGLVLLLTVVAVAVPVAVPNSTEQSADLYAEIASNAVLVLLSVVAVLTVTAEWSQRTALSTFTQEPRRIRVLVAKTLVALGLGVVGSVLALGAAFAGLGVSSTLGRDVVWQLDTGRLAGLFLSVALSLLGAVAMAALLQNTPAAIVAVFVAPAVVGILGALLRGLTRWVDLAQASTWVLLGEWSGHTAYILSNVVLWVVLPLGLGVLRTQRREVT